MSDPRNPRWSAPPDLIPPPLPSSARQRLPQQDPPSVELAAELDMLNGRAVYWLQGGLELCRRLEQLGQKDLAARLGRRIHIVSSMLALTPEAL